MKEISKVKKEKGITLIALIITIILLLILASVTIKLVLGDNGIIKYSKEAKENYINAQEYETEKIIDLGTQIDDIIKGKKTNDNQWDEQIYEEYRLTGYSGQQPTLQDDGKYHYTVTMPYDNGIATATIISDNPKLGGYVENRPYYGYNYKDDMYYVVWGTYVQFYTEEGNAVYRDLQDGRCFKIVNHDGTITYVDIRCDFPVFETQEDLQAWQNGDNTVKILNRNRY